MALVSSRSGAVLVRVSPSECLWEEPCCREAGAEEPWSRGPGWAVLWFWRLSMITRTVPPTAVWSPYTRASALCCWRRPMRTGGRRGGSGSEPRPNPYMCRRRTSLSYRSASSAPRWPPANQRPRPSRWSHEVLSHPACKRTAQVRLIVPFMFGGGFTVLHLRVSSITILSLITRNGQCTLRPKSCFSHSSSFPIKRMLRIRKRIQLNLVWIFWGSV